jgi:hypothetical protein
MCHIEGSHCGFGLSSRKRLRIMLSARGAEPSTTRYQSDATIPYNDHHDTAAGWTCSDFLAEDDGSAARDM